MATTAILLGLVLLVALLVVAIAHDVHRDPPRRAPRSRAVEPVTAHDRWDALV